MIQTRHAAFGGMLCSLLGGLAVSNPVLAQNPLRTDRVPTANLAKGYVQPKRQAISGSDLRLLDTRLHPFEKHMNKLGFTLANRNDVWNAYPAITANAIAAQNHINDTAGIYDPQISGTTRYDSFSKDWQSGNKSSLWAEAKISLTHSASRSFARIQGEADVNGALLGHTGSLARATADFYAPKTGDQSASMNLTIMGQTIWSKSQTGATVTIGDGFDWNGKLWQLGFDWSIAGYGVGAEIWLQGAVGAHFGGSCQPMYAEVGGNASASVGVGGRAWANLGIVDASLDAQLTLVNADISALASTQSSVLTIRTKRATSTIATMNVKRVVDVDMDFLRGHAIVKVDAFGFNVANWTLWNAPNGLYEWSGVLDNYNKTYLLP